MNINNENEFGGPAIKLGPLPSETIEAKCAQERNMGFNEGWLAAIARIQNLLVSIGLELDNMKDYRR